MITVGSRAVTLHLYLLTQKHTLPIVDCLIILNMPLSQVFAPLFIPIAKHIICADGGANRLYNSSYRDTPNLRTITGDLDSLEPETKSYYEGRGVEVIQDRDQNTNDL